MGVSGAAASVSGVPPGIAVASLDHESEARDWIRALRSTGRDREEAAARLHALLLRAARFELRRRRAALDGRLDSLEDLATQSADNALTAILAKLDQYRYESRFTTLAYKFAILEAAVAARRRAWQDRELPVDPQDWTTLPAQRSDPVTDLESRERLQAVIDAVREELSPHQREVLAALVLAQIPVDVLAERLNTTRGALYKTLHDARRRLRTAIEEPNHD